MESRRKRLGCTTATVVVVVGAKSEIPREERRGKIELGTGVCSRSTVAGELS